MSIGENIRRLREKKSMTQEELAVSIGVGRSMVTQIERGSKIPSLLLGRSITQALDCNLEDLFEERP